MKTGVGIALSIIGIIVGVVGYSRPHHNWIAVGVAVALFFIGLAVIRSR